MSDPLHLEKVRAGALVWNKWRRDNPGIEPDLNGLRISASELQFGAVQGGPVDFSRTELTQAALVHATLIEANLAGAVLVKADMSYARLNKADLRGADLRGAKLAYADLTDARLEGAFVCNADLRHARGLTQLQIDRAFGGEGTLLPADLEVPTTWLAEDERERQRGDGQDIDSSVKAYELLGVKPKASMQEIRIAWLRHVKELHPDIAADDPSAGERLKAINRAYQGLKSLEQREIARRAHRRPSTGAATFAVFLLLPIAATFALAVWTHGLPALREATLAAVTEQGKKPAEPSVEVALAPTQEAEGSLTTPELRYQPNPPDWFGDVLPTSIPERTDNASDDDLAWSQAAAEATTASLHHYLGRHPEGRHERKAADDLAQLAAVEVALGTHHAARDATAMQRDLPVLRRYLLEYPTGQLAEEARRKLEILEAGARPDVAWSSADQKDSKADEPSADVAARATDTTVQSGRQDIALAETAGREPAYDPIAGAEVPQLNAEHAEQADLDSPLEPKPSGRYAEGKPGGLDSLLDPKPATAAASSRHAKQVFRTARPVASTAHATQQARSMSEPFVGADGRIR